MGSSEPASSRDEDVVRRVQAGDVDAFELLVERHQAQVARVVARQVPPQLVADLAHEVFVSAYLSLDGFAPTHPFEHWLTRIALRTCSDHWRRQFRERDRSEPGPDPTHVAAAVDHERPDEDRELLERALGQLGPEDRQVLTLVYFEGLSIRECAELTGKSESNVKVRAHRARKRLREWLARLQPRSGR